MYFHSCTVGVVITAVPEHDAEGSGVQSLQTTDLANDGATAEEDELLQYESVASRSDPWVVIGTRVAGPSRKWMEGTFW